MSTALQTIAGFNLASMVSSDAFSNMTAAFESAEGSFSGGGAPTLTFKGRDFHIRSGDVSTTLNERVVDFYLVGIRDTDHVTFFNTTYDDKRDSSSQTKSLTRPMTAADPKSKDWKPEGEWVSRTRQRRCVIMLANDSEYRLILADFGELSIYGARKNDMGLYNLGQVIRQMATFRKHNPAFLPFMFKLQMSFTTDSVPVVQFSFADQVNRGGEQLRAADPRAVSKIAEYWQSGEVTRLLNMWFDTPEAEQSAPAPVTAAPAPAPVTAAPAPAPVTAAPAPVQDDDDELLPF